MAVPASGEREEAQRVSKSALSTLARILVMDGIVPEDQAAKVAYQITVRLRSGGVELVSAEDLSPVLEQELAARHALVPMTGDVTFVSIADGVLGRLADLGE
jgi:2-phosphoglycerate kinase